MSRVGITIAVLLIAAGAVRADSVRGPDRSALVASLTRVSPATGTDGTSLAVAADSKPSDNSLSRERRAPVPPAVWTGLATLGVLGWVRRKRRRAQL